MEYKYKEEDINKVLNYLGTKPYAEALPYVNLLMNGTPIETSDQDTQPTEAVTQENTSTEVPQTNE